MRADIQRHRLGTALVVALAAAGLPQAAPAATRGYIALAIPPSTNSEVLAAAIDLNGDGIADNQFAQVLIALGSLNLDFSAPVTSGQVVYLMRVTSADATFQNDTAALGEWIVGQPTAPLPPDFSGGGSFQIAPGIAPGRFIAPLAAAAFVSANPVTTVAPVEVPFELRLGENLIIPLTGARLAFTVTPGGLTNGQLNGSIREEDVQAIIIPGFAIYLNQVVAAGGPDAMTVLAIFDTGCNGVGANDGMIAVCEVANNSLITSLLVPDVDIYAPDGSYAPNPANTDPDSLSFDLRFTAANAQVPLEVVFADSFE